MTENTHLSDTYQNGAEKLPSNFDFKALSHFFTHTDTDEWLSTWQHRFYQAAGMNNTGWAQVKTDMLEYRLDRAKTRWACITAETQRQQKSQNGIAYQCHVYQDLATIKPMYERAGASRPPDNTGNFIYRFSERSRYRLMERARRLNKEGEALPYFATLTYHENFKDPEQAKKHLNVFLERWRKRCRGYSGLPKKEFKYFWKMEPQKRGAVHFHLAMFIPEPVQRLLRIRHRAHLNGNKNFKHSCLDAIRLQVGNDWAQVTADVNGYDVPFTRFDYIRSRDIKPEKYQFHGQDFTVNTRLANPRTVYKMEPGILNRLYGTNVRPVENWKMFLGYIYKYMQKDVEAHPFGRPECRAQVQPARVSFPRPPYRFFTHKIHLNVKKTGRFWGFSYNLDFQALTVGIVGHEQAENVNAYCNALNAFALATLAEHLTDNARRAREALADKPRKLTAKLKKYRNTWERQKKRYLANKNKILDGYPVQFEIPAELTLKCERYLRSKSVNEFFNFDQEPPADP